VTLSPRWRARAALAPFVIGGVGLATALSSTKK
jgi:hypothetical protein